MTVVTERTFTAQQRRDLADKGHALPDGGFPIVNRSDLSNALRALGRASNKTAAKRHIIKRARALGAISMLPDDWGVTEAAAITESRPLVEAATPAEGPGQIFVTMITPGWGTSGYYSPAVLEAAAKNRVFPAGLHMYIDHPTDTEAVERPERSVRDLAAVLTEDARWEGGALKARARTLASQRQFIADLAEHIGVSIRAEADIEIGEAEGRRGRIITEFLDGGSVDFVTSAGRGGRYQVIESARTPVSEARNVGQWLESRIHRDFTVVADEMAGEGRLTREERIALSGAIGDALGAFVTRLEADAPELYSRDLWDDPEQMSLAAERAVRRGVAESTAEERREDLGNALRDVYGGERQYAWVRDFDDSTVWYQRDGGNTSGIYAEGYTVGDDDRTVTLAGDPVEVRVETSYVPVPASADESGTTDQQPPTTDEPPETGTQPDTEDPAPDPSNDATTENADPAPEDSTTGEPVDNPEEPIVADQSTTEATGPVRTVIEQQLAQERAETARIRAREQARRVLGEALRDDWVPPATVSRITESLMERLPMADGQLNEAELVKMAGQELAQAEREIAEALQAGGMGRPRDLGSSSDGGYAGRAGGLGGAELDKRLEESFKGLGLTETQAAVAAKGRD